MQESRPQRVGQEWPVQESRDWASSFKKPTVCDDQGTSLRREEAPEHF